MAPNRSMGRRLQAYRLRRRMTQEVLAGRIGKSISWLSQIERGLRGVEKWRVLLELAEALEVDPRELIETPVALGPNGGVAFEAISAIRAALTDYTTFMTAIGGGPSEGRARSNLPAVRQNVDHANRLYQAAHYLETGRLVADLIAQAELASRDPNGDSRESLAALAEVYYIAAKTLTKVSETELSWVAAERGIGAAQRAEDPLLIGAGAYHLGHAFLRAGRTDESVNVTERAASALMSRRHVDPSEQALVGALSLTALLGAARANDAYGVREFLNRARRVAAALGKDGNDHWIAFGPTNVAIHELSVAIELGDVRAAVRQGERIDTSKLDARLVGRRTQVLLDLARAYGQRRQDAAAVNTLLEAERAAPETVRYGLIVRELVREMLAREHRRSTPELRGLARRLDLIT